MLKEEIEKRRLPDVLTLEGGGAVKTKEQWQKRRPEIIRLLCREEYGNFPPQPESRTAQILLTDDDFCAGKAAYQKVLLHIGIAGGEFSFPVFTAIPKSEGKCPAFVHINSSGGICGKFMPTEELCDNGFAVFSFDFQDITKDREFDFESGLEKLLFKNGARKNDDCGKLAMWAWGACRVMDYVMTLGSIDSENVAVVGFSRLGKAALLAGGLDERFAFVISNESGCSGAALTRGKQGEHIKNISGAFPYWFCKNYAKYADNEDALPFDQHFLLALAAPRCLYVSSAERDLWSDPESEYLSCAAAEKVWRLFDKEGFVGQDRFPHAGDCFLDGSIGYHLRKGTHYLSRYDWQQFMKFMRCHLRMKD